ncbi:MAG: DoxX family membrane protein [bacterium]|nr:DoxX family membrane protein [bacterium]
MSVKRGPSQMLENLPTRFLLSPVVYHAVRLFMGGLFIYSGVPKLADIAGFGASVAAYGILPAFFIPCAAVGLPAMEVAAGLGTLLNRRWAILGLLAMMILFLGVVGYGVATGLEIDCGCFSTETGKKAETAPKDGQAEDRLILEIPDQEAVGLFDDTEVFVGPVQPAGDEETCSEEEAAAAGTSLRQALVRDVYLFLGALYLVAWPDLRRRYRRPERASG